MEIKETGISHFKSVEEITTALNSHFKTISAEKHPQAMLRFIISNAADKTLKNVYKNKSKISIAVQDRFKDGIIMELRRYYGEWANIYNFNLKRAVFRSNFDLIFKTEFGRLYGNSPGTIHDHVFYTSHCFEQHALRGDCYKFFPLLTLAYKRIKNTTPTSADILRFIAVNASEFCEDRQFMYVNVDHGVLVFEKLSRGILIAKTFLLPDMDFPKKGWITSRCYGFMLDRTDDGREIQNKYIQVPIEKPEFFRSEWNYSEYVKILNQPALNS